MRDFLPQSMQKYSLKWRLVSMCLVVFITLWAVVFSWLYYNLEKRLQETLDQRLSASAHMVARLIQNLPLQSINQTLLKNQQETDTQNNIACEVSFFSSDISVGHQVVARTRGAPQNLSQQNLGFSTWQQGEVQWRSYVLRKNDIQVVAAERLHLRESLLKQILASLFIPLILTLLLCIGLIIHIVRKEFQPLDHIAQSLEQKHDDLNHAITYLATLHPHAIPYEVQPFVNNALQLIQNLQRSLENEKSFTAYAAHELRSPLTAIKTHVQLSQMMLKQNPIMASSVIENLKQAEYSIWRYEQLLEQLLLLSHVEHQPKPDFKHQHTQLKPVIQHVISELNQKYRETEKIINVDWQSLNCMPISESALNIIFSNLIENSFLHAHELTTISIYMQDQNLYITDDGKNIHYEDLSDFTKRFWRKSSQQKGHGLGLSLLEIILNKYDFQMSLKNNIPQGLKVIIFAKY